MSQVEENEIVHIASINRQLLQLEQNVIQNTQCPCIHILPVDIDTKMFPKDYGISECKPHDQNLKPDCTTNQEEYCILEWCYVDKDNCSVTYRASKFYNNVYYSYATCGNLDRWYNYGLSKSLKGKHLKISAPSNTGGWKGSYIKENSIYNSTVYRYGPIWYFFEELQKRSGFTYEFVLPSQRAKEYSPGSSFTATVFDISTGVIDIGIAGFTLTETRFELTEFTTVVLPENLHMCAHKVDGSPVLLFFEPFRWTVWIMNVFITLFLLGFVVILEYYNEDMDERDIRRTSFSVYQFDSEKIKKKESHWLLFILYIFLGLMIAAYTANLVDYLTKDTRYYDYKNLQEAISKDKKICVQRVNVKSLYLSQDLKKSNLHIVNTRSEILSGMENGYCAVGIIAEGDLEKLHSEGNLLNYSQTKCLWRPPIK